MSCSDFKMSYKRVRRMYKEPTPECLGCLREEKLQHLYILMSCSTFETFLIANLLWISGYRLYLSSNFYNLPKKILSHTQRVDKKKMLIKLLENSYPWFSANVLPMFSAGSRAKSSCPSFYPIWLTFTIRIRTPKKVKLILWQREGNKG
jgi:hypothetical protein